MKLVVIFSTLFICLVAKGETYHVGGAQVTKLNAIKTLINDPGAEVVKCQAVELSDKATLKIKKQPKNKE